jgi:hypothetical protein
MNDPSKHSDENTLKTLLPDTSTVGVFCISNRKGLQDDAFLVLSWSREQEQCGFILVQAHLAEVTAQCLAVCY